MKGENNTFAKPRRAKRNGAATVIGFMWSVARHTRRLSEKLDGIKFAAAAAAAGT